jgi:aspartyl-tRNA(Asn)/glutamyl-tRNA(Gln) amidotransferase subunit B
MTTSLIKTIANIIASSLINYSVKLDKPLDQLISKDNLIYLATLFDNKEINNQSLIIALEYLFDHQEEKAQDVITKLNLIQVNDESVLLEYVNEVIETFTQQTSEYRSGKTQIIGFLVGQCMKISNKQGNPATFKSLLERQLSI